MPAAQFRCPYCHTSEPSRSAVNRHISQKAACREKWRESLGIVVSVAREESEAPEEPPMGSETPPHPASPMFTSHELPEDDGSDDSAADGFIAPPPSASPEPPEPPQSRGVTVEEVLDEDDPQNFSRFVEAFPGEEDFPGRTAFVGANATTIGEGETVFERMRAAQAAAGVAPHTPFSDEDEWELANWLSKNVSQTVTDVYLKLPITQRRTRVSYRNNYAYLQKVDQLPTGPGWKCEIVTAAGNQLDENDEMMKEDLELWKRDPVECIKELMGNPAFHDFMAFKAMHAHAGLRHFKKGISAVSQWTGTKHKEMQRVFMGVLAGAVNAQVLTVVKSLIDFIYYAQFQSHTTRTLDALQYSLDTFHANKSILVTLGIREHFNIPKIHSLQHYVSAIRSLGSADGYNTEAPERLHIDFAKKAYRSSNKRDYTSQMTVWLQRQEAFALRQSYLDWLDHKLSSEPEGEDDDASDDEGVPATAQRRDTELTVQVPASAFPSVTYSIPKAASFPDVTVAQLETIHGAIDFLPAFAHFIQKFFPRSTIEPVKLIVLGLGALFSSTQLSFVPSNAKLISHLYKLPLVLQSCVEVWRKLAPSVYVPQKPNPLPKDLGVLDSSERNWLSTAKDSFRLWTHSTHYFYTPSHRHDRFAVYKQLSIQLARNRSISDKAPTLARGRSPGVPAHFDTALVIEDPDQYRKSSGVQGLRVAQIRAIFMLPPQYGSYPHPLAYIEWFTPFNRPEKTSGMCIVHRSSRAQRCNAAVVSVEHLVRNCHLMGKAGAKIDRTWTTDNVLDKASYFYFNTYINVDSFARDRHG
ncbi:hypothetical protein B0H17DRAFT_1185009 [Mycena rosella]|uniref:Uncharacterized protein n=1 Tax=Mycena rosella TaxID=1033263 RepID=A0AAD7G7A2_MYCRO|nr:hypothetical protein B0H17DRAFT_1185009 [Mycena rosella]